MTSFFGNTKPSLTRQWWKEAESESLYKHVMGAIRFLDNAQASRHERNRHHLKLYSQRAFYDLVGEEAPARRDDVIRFNLVQGIIDAAVAQIATNRPRLYHLTENGNWRQQRSAKQGTKFTDGQFYEVDQYAKSVDVFQDAAITGTGIQKTYVEEDKIRADVSFLDDILVDTRLRQKPRQIFEYTEVPRELLLDAYPEHADKIKDAGAGVRRNYLRNRTLTDVVGVGEAFHLRSGQSATDGRHALVLDNVTLVDERWDEDFPYEFFRWGRSPTSFWGWGIAEILSSLQVEVNYLLQKIQRCMTLASSQIWLQKNTKIAKQQLTNEDFAVHTYAGTPPIFMAVQAISPEFASHLSWLLQRAYELTGISMLHATSQKPAGLNSGKAIESYNDTTSQRFLHVHQEYERFHQRVGKRMFRCAEMIQEKTGSYQVRGRSRKGFEYINIKEIASCQDAIQVYPTSFFMKTPSGQWQQIEAMIQSGFIDRDEGATLLDYPDLEAVTSLRNAPFEYLKMVVDDMLEHGENAQIKLPDPGSKLELAARWLPFVILRAEQDGAPEENLEVVRQYYQAVKDMMKPPPPEMPAANMDMMQGAMTNGGISGATPAGPGGTLQLGPPGGTGLPGSTTTGAVA